MSESIGFNNEKLEFCIEIIWDTARCRTQTIPRYMDVKLGWAPQNDNFHGGPDKTILGPQAANI